MAKLVTEAIKRQERKANQKREVIFSYRNHAWKRLSRNKSSQISLVIVIALIIFAIFPQYIAPQGYDEQNYSIAYMSPCKEYPLGTDNFGRDILSRLIWGARMSMIVGITSVVSSVILGGIVGATAGFYGGKVDDFFMRIMDVLLAIPSMLFAIAIASALGGSLMNLMLAISISNIPTYARIVRGAIIKIKDQEFVEATRAIGASNKRLILKHMLPNALAPIIVQATLGIAHAIISACGLSYLGLGIKPPVAEWGSMLSSSKQYIRNYPYMVIFPGLSIMIAVGAFNLLGDGLRDALDPRMKR